MQAWHDCVCAVSVRLRCALWCDFEREQDGEVIDSGGRRGESGSVEEGKEEEEGGGRRIAIAIAVTIGCKLLARRSKWLSDIST